MRKTCLLAAFLAVCVSLCASNSNNKDKMYMLVSPEGFAVDNATIPEGWEPQFINMNDGSNEGIRHKTMPWFSAQFHPEASSGPTDTEFLFDEFISKL